MFPSSTLTFILVLLPILTVSAAPAPLPYLLARKASDQAPLAVPSSASSSDSNSTDVDSTKKIHFRECQSTGHVSEVSISPCEGGKGSKDDPCHFQAGRNYTITLSFSTPNVTSSQPRANLIARDRTLSNVTSQSYPYSGQSFDACQYTSCPIPDDTPSKYIYQFQTLNSRFDELTFNMTDGLSGPSLMCASFPVAFVPSDSS